MSKKVDLNKTTALIRSWSKKRGLDQASYVSQTLKLVEEVGELATSINKGYEAEQIDAIGDIYVVLTILAQQMGLKIEKCVELAYNEIKNRKGKLVNGIFVKEKDIKDEN